MSTMDVTNVLLVVAGIVLILGRRMAGELLEVKRLLIVPVALTVVGLLRLGSGWTPAACAFAALGVGISVALGLLRGRTVHLGRRGGELWMRYRWTSVALWVATILAKLALVPVERAVSPSTGSTADRAILLSVGLGVLAETAVVLLRAMRTDGEIVWTKGERGRPHTTNDTFDRVRAAVNEYRDPTRPQAANAPRRPLIRHDW